jgi:hypothetical protein
VLTVDVLLADTCACGDSAFHRTIENRILWCRMCGAARPFLGDGKWMIPLSRAADFPNSMRPKPPSEMDEVKTAPGVPGAKKSSDRLRLRVGPMSHPVGPPVDSDKKDSE